VGCKYLLFKVTIPGISVHKTHFLGNGVGSIKYLLDPVLFVMKKIRDPLCHPKISDLNLYQKYVNDRRQRISLSKKILVTPADLYEWQCRSQKEAGLAGRGIRDRPYFNRP
jgi:hypothetical protein